MKTFIIFTLFMAMAMPVIYGQIKTRPVPPPQSGNLILNVTGVNHTGHPLSGLDLFINQTRSGISSGICFTEVPTASLINDPRGYVPEGNGSDPSLSRIQVCCEGYERNVHNFRQCDPICRNECTNGICVAPNVCRCFPDHVLNRGGFCIPTCPIGCGNGDCNPSGHCACHPGYVLDGSQRFCVPRCSGCIHGNCTAPEECRCDPGFVRSRNPNSEEKCVVDCGECRNGVCTAPGSCLCNPGYVQKNGICEAVCSRGCNNGICTAPNECSCRPGFTLDPTGTNCIAHCDTPCLNGYCNGPNICACHPGYIADEFRSNICNPHCPNGCPNGVCSGPNMCICNAGYVKDRSVKGSQVCVRA